MDIIKKINIVFIGTADFGLPTLNKFVLNQDSEYDFNLKLIITQPDRPKGRNLGFKYSLIKETALLKNIPLLQPENINEDDIVESIKKCEPDIIVTIAYGGYIGKTLRTICPLGAINLHPSLLPLHRGADPVRSTLLAKDEYCGNTIYFLTSKIDSGPIIKQKSYKISDLEVKKNFTYIEYFLSKQGAEDMVEVIKQLEQKNVHYSELKKLFPQQDHSKATLSKKLEKNSAYADFNLSADEFINNVRSYSYRPGYVCKFRGKRLEIYEAEIIRKKNNEKYPEVTEIIKNVGFVISLKDADVLIKEVQYEGKKMMSSWDFNKGMRLQIGETFESI
ncbi:MAG: methionyl-tRNA formyltransferase [Candidatus Cloacimonetes bacterium]|nr:methionyl-tRNA formyltransferase [Candidatus Cloacimonadota bacterium]